MEVFHTEDHYIILDGDYSLWCDRNTGTLEPKRGLDVVSAWNPVCVGRVYGVIGKIQVHHDSDWKLIFIRQRSFVGKLRDEHDVYRIDKIVMLSLSNTDPCEFDLDLCEKHHFGMKKGKNITKQAEGQQKALQKTWKTIKSAAENVKPKKKDFKDKDKFTRRILEEMQKMYNDSEFFFYSPTYDLTNNLQSQHSLNYKGDNFMWKRVNKQFFWNQHLISDLCNDNQTGEPLELSSHWVIPIIQGYFQIEECVLDPLENLGPSSVEPEFGVAKHEPLKFKLGIISRRSIHYAGTRTKKRGLDEEGYCANYVETEQILEFSSHTASFVQVRGSIPVFWSQSGIKYRPPPKLDRDDAQTKEAFQKHFSEQLQRFKHIFAINLAELFGKEKAISDAYLHQIIEYNSDNVTYIMFDFHEYCRGMKFENVSILTDTINDLIKQMRYCWVDRKGMICEQQGVFRVNCVDCLDRTNVVQTAIARIVMETQCRKLGMLAPDENLTQSIKKTFQQLWANNGDIISRQYAGTAALKGDYTRTGERKLTGMMKDGVNSANRYYLRFKDSYRQAMFDLTLGRPVTMEEYLLLSNNMDSEEDTAELMEKEQNLKLLVEDCKEMLIVEPEQCLGGWSLINADPMTGDPERTDMDVILLLSQRAVYVAWYDDEEEQLVQYQRIFLEDLEKIEIGPEPAMFKSKFVVMRLHYTHFAEDGFFHSFRIPKYRLFNNMIIAVQNQEEAKESLKAIYEAFYAARQILALDLELEEKTKLERKRPRPHPEIFDIHKQQQENALRGIHVPRDVSATDLQTMKLGTPGSRSPKSPRSMRSTPGSKDRSPAVSPLASRKNMLPNFSDVKKTLNKGINLNFSVPKISLQNVSLPKRFGGQGSHEAKKTSNEPSPDKSPRSSIGDQRMNTFRVRQLSQDDSILGRVSDSFDETYQVDDSNLVLDSCGIVSTTKVLVSPPSVEVNKEDNSSEQVIVPNDCSCMSESNNLKELHLNDNIDDDDVFGVMDSTGAVKSKSQKSSMMTLSPIGTAKEVMKVMNPQVKTRKLQRIIEGIEKDINEKLKNKCCVTPIIFV